MQYPRGGGVHFMGEGRKSDAPGEEAGGEVE